MARLANFIVLLVALSGMLVQSAFAIAPPTFASGFISNGPSQLNQGTSIVGSVYIQAIANPSAPSVTVNTVGSSTDAYAIVGHDGSATCGSGHEGHSAVSSFTTVTNATNPPDNSIVLPTAYAYYDVLKGNNTTSLATCVAGGSTVVDTGQSTASYSPPASNTTGQFGAALSSLSLNGPFSLIGTSQTGGDIIANANVNGVGNVLDWGVLCNSTTDNNPSSSGPLQTAINTISWISAPSTGILTIPASCNAATGHHLKYSTTITWPANFAIVGLAGACYDTDSGCVQLDYSGSGVAMLMQTVHAPELYNVRINNTGTGTIGLQIDGSFDAKVSGVAIVGGFSQYGLDLSDLSATTDYATIERTTSIGNNIACALDGSLSSAHAVSANTFINTRCYGSTGGAEQILLNSYSASGAGAQNVYDNNWIGGDISESGGNATIGVVSNAAMDTTFSQLTSENLPLIFQLNAGTQNFVADDEAAVVATGNTSDIFTSDPANTYRLCFGYIAGLGTGRCYDMMGHKNVYEELNTLQDPTGQFATGPLQNLALNSEDYTQSSWSHSGTSSITANNATAPNNASTASTAVVTAGGAAYLQGTYSLGSSIAGTCWTLATSIRTNASSATAYVRTQLALYDSNGSLLSDNPAGASIIGPAYKRIYLTSCASGSDSATGIEFRPLYITANAPSASFDIWGTSVCEGNAPCPYIKTSGAAMNAGSTPPVGATSANYYLGGVPLFSNTAPTISSGFGTSPSIVHANGNGAFTLNVGSGGSASSGVIGLPTAPNGWTCHCTDITTNSSSVFLTKQSATTSGSCTVTDYNDSATATAWSANDVLSCQATPY